jgi:hypothetical protein
MLSYFFSGKGDKLREYFFNKVLLFFAWAKNVKLKVAHNYPKSKSPALLCKAFKAVSYPKLKIASAFLT